MRITLTILVAALLALNGVAMIAAPAAWYASVPGVPGTGPLNTHFVRDIGCAYLVSGGALFWRALDERAWHAAMAGAIFLILHALTHVWDTAAGRESVAGLMRDLPAVFIVALLALWLAWPHARPRE
ncbi:MAG TPA: hypothetical protein VKS22_01290 [Candidatus Binataceae bacterium]|nr:hypothetical protein [Candidatus Binataceae bacterium]